jgi:hypothetical protein
MRFLTGDTMQSLSTPRTTPKLIAALIAAFSIIAQGLVAAPASAQTCPFDDGNSSLAVEGLILTRYALGITGAPLVNNTGINAVDAPTVEAAINCPSCGLNITGNATLTVADATIISRKLAGITGTALTNGLALGSGTRNTPAAVQSFLLAGCGASGGTVTSITAGTGLTGGTITGTGTIAADTAFLQRRVSSACAAGSAISAIAADGTVTCVTPTTGSSGTVTNIATGAGLTGGTITTTGTINLTSTQLLPTTACSTDQIAKWNGSAWVCGPSVQSQLASCVPGQFLQLGPNGNIVCGTTPVNIFTMPTSSGLSGIDISMAIAGDGVTHISFYNEAGGNLNGWECGDAACQWRGRGLFYDVTAADVGRYNSMAIGTDGRPIISYYDVTSADLKVFKCGTGSPGSVPNNGCSNSNVGIGLTRSVVDSVGDVGKHSAIEVPADGLPVVAYLDATNNTLKVAKCGNSACSNSNTLTNVQVGAAGTAGSFASSIAIAISADGLPIIAYRSGTTSATRVVKCGNATCGSGNTFTDLPNGFSGIGGEQLSIATSPVDGLPVITGNTNTGASGALRLVKCGNAACSSGNTTHLVSGVADSSSVKVSADNRPVISFRGTDRNDLRVLKCGNSNCTSGNTITTVDAFSLGTYTALALPADGKPIIAYYDYTNLVVKVAKCSNASCLNP